MSKITRSKLTAQTLYTALIVHQLFILFFFLQGAHAICQVFTLPCAQGGMQPVCVTQPQELALACPT